MRVKGRKLSVIAGLAVLVCLLILGGVFVWWYGSKVSPPPHSSPKSTAARLPQPTGPLVTSSVGPNKNLPAQHAGSDGCAKMDAVLANLLVTPQGKALTRAEQKDHDPNVAPGKLKGSGTQWIAFLDLVHQRRADFERMAGADPRARQALTDMDVVADIEPKLLDKRIPKYVDEKDAFEQLEAGRTPAQNPRYLEAIRRASAALDRLSWCMPSWPVQF